MGSNVVTLRGMPSMTESAVPVQGGEELDSDTLLALTATICWLSYNMSKLLIIYSTSKLSHT